MPKKVATRPDFTLEQSAFFLTSQFDNEKKWAKTDLTLRYFGAVGMGQNACADGDGRLAEVSGADIYSGGCGRDPDIDLTKPMP